VATRWKYDDPNPGHLAELDLTLEPYQEFDAPDGWEPNPNPSPVFKPVRPAKANSAPTTAPSEE
jgi:hypothetical protein